MLETATVFPMHSAIQEDI